MKLSRPIVLQVLLTVFCLFVGGYSLPLLAQSAGGTLGARPTIPQWQTDAGGKMAFDVASVKPSNGQVDTNINLSGLDDAPPNGGLLSANFPLIGYILFAYKLSGDQLRLLQPQMPKWAAPELFDIEARADGKPTRDQMRLMMQSLLADRFKLAVHWESRQLPVFALVLEKPGKTGPQLQPHSDDPPCAAPPGRGQVYVPPPADVAGGFPPICGALVGLRPSVPGRNRFGARNLTMEQIASHVPGPHVDRPVLDQTGLSGRFDFWLDYTPEFNGPPPPNFQPDATGPTFLEALKEQLGLKLVPETGPVDVLVIDHVEEPSPN